MRETYTDEKRIAVPKTAILDKLEDERVIDMALSTDLKTLYIHECCDYFFEAKLTKSDVKDLAKTFSIIAESMKD